VELDADGYMVAVDGDQARPIEVNASLEIGSLENGPHVVELTGLALNCAVQGDQARTVETSSDATVEVEFEVECGPSVGTVNVITRTGGEDQDPDGYVVVVAGEARQVALDGSLAFEDVQVGPTIAEILGVAPNCTATTQTYYELTVVGGATVDVAFIFECTRRQPQSGSLQVAVSTTGSSPDPDGYLVSVDGGSPTPLAISGTVLLTGLSIGERSVGLSGIAANCTVSGSNPRPVSVSGTELAAIGFAVVCTQPTGATGTLRVTTATTGSDLDPTGYLVSIDGNPGQPLGLNHTVSIAGLPAGAHTVSLLDVTPNCTVPDNPRTVSVPSGGQVDLAFTVSCVPATGAIATSVVTTGTNLDADGYIARVNGGAGKVVPANGTVIRAGLAPGAHTVQLDNVASNCQVQGDNPRAAVVAGNDTTAVTFEVTCAAATGSLMVAVTGLPGGVFAEVSVTGPDGYLATVVSTATLSDLKPGNYTVTAAAVAFNGETYQPGAERQNVSVGPGIMPTVTVSYSNTPGALNLRIDGMYVTQSSQRPDGTVPLIQDRDGYLRVFVVASGDNTATPSVRVRLFHDGAQVQTLSLSAASGSTPTVTREQPLEHSWNVRIPGLLIRRGLAILAEVDADGAYAESNEGDNFFPLDATPARMDVRTAPVFAVRLVPVQLGSGGLTGDVSAGNFDRYLSTTASMHPLPGIDVDLHGTYTSSQTPEQAGSVNDALFQALSELRMLRAVEGDERHYYGVTHRNYSSGGIAGIGSVGYPAALGWDDPSGAGQTAAHEFGHNWGRRHAPCGNPNNVDPGYPHVGATLGAFGLDLRTERLIEPSTHDLMSYCHPRWVSDYTYINVMAFRGTAAERSSLMARDQRVQPSLVIWGRVVNGHPILEPAFLVQTTPALPAKAGPYRLDAVDGVGGTVLSLSFAADPVADAVDEQEHFAFAVPINPTTAAGIRRLVLTSPRGASELNSSAALRAGPAPTPDMRRVAGRIEVRWDVSSAPMVLLRDAASGEVLALGRGGALQVPDRGAETEVYVSYGVGSRRLRLP
jgi:hypothetical protein